MLHNTTVHTKFHGILATFCPCNMSHEIQQVELRATCRGDKISPKLVLHSYKSISSQEGTCRCNISLGHVSATFSCVCKCCDFVRATCPRYSSVKFCCMSPQYVLHKFFVPATCRRDMSLQHDPFVSAHLYS